jgi:hypothetical protein
MDAPVPSALPSAAAAREGTSVPAPETQSAVKVTSARLCRTLSTSARGGGDNDWPCAPASLPVSAGPLFFYTRLTSPTDTTVEHRWYRGDRLQRAVELRIGANTTSGYRTYSRNTVNSQGGGDWRVELRTGAGTVLHEERFAVR